MIIAIIANVIIITLVYKKKNYYNSEKLNHFIQMIQSFIFYFIIIGIKY